MWMYSECLETHMFSVFACVCGFFFLFQPAGMNHFLVFFSFLLIFDERSPLSLFLPRHDLVLTGACGV